MVIGYIGSGNLLQLNPSMTLRGYMYVASTANKGVLVTDAFSHVVARWMDVFNENHANTVPIGSVGVMRLISQGI